MQRDFVNFIMFVTSINSNHRRTTGSIEKREREKKFLIPQTYTNIVCICTRTKGLKRNYSSRVLRKKDACFKDTSLQPLSGRDSYTYYRQF